MQLITRNKLNKHLIKKRLSKFQNCYQIKNSLVFWSTLWQDLTDLPAKFKNGSSWLLTEKIIVNQLNNLSIGDEIELYFIDEQLVKEKHLVTLELRIIRQQEMVIKIQLILLAEESWNEFFLKV
ncbi:MAG: hypothetical protein ABF631_05655 [Liquorilactobacillus nagelii]|uniref:hypothetical protein n=1 Tax=Liquorilactobacillus nagelii TaxID=82688 RepID=UPI0039E86813